MFSRQKHVIAFVVLGTFLLGLTAYSQQRGRSPRGGSQASLAQPFRGIVANGKIEPGLFAIASTGVTTEPVRKAAEAFLSALNDEQRQRTVYLVDDLEWRQWDNRHFYKRQGVGFDEMDEKLTCPLQTIPLPDQ